MMKTSTEKRAELIFDGFGINGPDEYRSRLATFTQGMDSGELDKYGNLFSTSPKMLDFIKRLNTAFYSGTTKEIKEIMMESKSLIHEAEGR